MVIAIIAILAAILFPVFARAKAKAEQASCLSNCKQLILAFIQYAHDYDMHLPLVSKWGSGATPLPLEPELGGVPWCGHVGYLYPYLQSLDVQSCPSGVSNADEGTELGYPRIVPGYLTNYCYYGPRVTYEPYRWWGNMMNRGGPGNTWTTSRLPHNS